MNESNLSANRTDKGGFYLQAIFLCTANLLSATLCVFLNVLPVLYKE